ncbi:MULTISPECIES: AI-2E family transporter [unclassified Actinomyces]|uniref:AI-2E family transporter n=1 Tax=unclassified Actinomyces TaxID=2609248 RepID=UPI00137396AD|nr:MULTISPECIES: AI-2E family transporter [unclassified Actinomyces]NDR54028.1 AI-2E family transporter [Actinomyces sp. 565]QHO90814.1 AI-2E family transporter [Actinomyces sp. 432]
MANADTSSGDRDEAPLQDVEPNSDAAASDSAFKHLTSRLREGRDVLGRTIDRAERARLDAREQQLHYEDSQTADAAGAEGDVSPAVPRSPLSSLPSWLVRGGISAWLLLGLLIVISLVFFATSRVIPVFVGVFMALVLTSILQPLVNLFARVMPRYPATFLGLLSALALVVGLVTYVVTSVTSQWNTLASQFSDGVDTIVDFIVNGPLPLDLTQQELTGQLQQLVRQGQDYLMSNAPTLATEVLSNAGTVVNIFAVLALAVFTTIFFLASGGRMWRWFLNELPASMREDVHHAAGAGWYTFAGYARGTVLVALTDGIMCGIFLQIVSVPLAAPLAVLVFIGAFIPIIGAPAAMIIAMVVALASKGFITMIVVGLGVAGIGQIEGHILQPLIMGRQVSLHPVVVIIAVAVGTYSAGLLGAIVAVPLVSVAWSVYSELHTKDAPVVGELPAYSGDKG